MIDIKKLKTFIFDAKKNTFASSRIFEPTIDGLGKIYKYKSAEYTYTDIYYGSVKEVGNEFVTFKGGLVWGMAYYGGIEQSHYDKLDEVNLFLKKSLCYIDQKFPCRGISGYVDDNFRYSLDISGEYNNFSALELVYHQEELVCKHTISGGRILRKKQLPSQLYKAYNNL